MNDTIDNTLYSIQANKIRTNLLLHSLSELHKYKHNQTRINSKLSSDLLMKYESIEIQIVNPLERGNMISNQSQSFLIERTRSNSSTGTPCPEEIGNFVYNLNRKLFSERKLSKTNGAILINLKPAKPNIHSSIIMTKKKLTQMKKSCQYLRRLASHFICRKTKAMMRKLSNQRVTMPPKMCFDFNLPQETETDYDNGLYGMATQRYNSKATFNLDNELLMEKSLPKDANSRNKKKKKDNMSAKKHKTNNIFRMQTSSTKDEESKKDEGISNIKGHFNEEVIDIKKNTHKDTFNKVKCFISNGRSLPFNFRHTEMSIKKN